MDLCFQGSGLVQQGPDPEHMAQARGFFERALALDPENVEAMVGTARADYAIVTGFLPMIGQNISPQPRGPSRRRCPWRRTIPWLTCPGPRANFYEPRGSRHRRMRAGVGAGSEFGRARTRIIGAAKLLSRSGRGNRSPYRAGTPPLSPRHHRLYVDAYLSVLPNFGAALTPKRSFGCAGALRQTEIIPMGHFYLAAALAHLGELDEARATVQAGLALNPSFTIRRFRTNSPSNHPCISRDGERVYEGLRMAGVPEG